MSATPIAYFAERVRAGTDTFLEALEQLGELTSEQALAAYQALHKARVLKVDPIIGCVSVKHGRFLDRDVLRRAAGIES